MIAKIEYSPEMKPEINSDEIDNLCTIIDNQLRHLYEYDTDQFGTAVLSIVCAQIEAIQGVFYQAKYEEDTPKLVAIAGFGVSIESLTQSEVKHRQGILGEVFQEFEQRWVSPLPAGHYLGHSSIAFFQAKTLIIMPLTMNYKLIGAIEILLLHELHPSYKTLIKRIIDSISILFFSILNNQRIKTLLTESQENARILKIKETELEANLAELESQKADLVNNETALRRANQHMAENYQKTENILQKLHVRETELEQKNKYVSSLLVESETAKNELIQKEIQLQEQLYQLHNAQKEITSQKEDLEQSVFRANKAQEIARRSLEISQKKMREYNEQISENELTISNLNRNLAEKDNYIQQLEKNIAELTQKKLILKKADTELHIIHKYFQQHQVYFRTTPAGNISQINATFASLFGLVRQDIVAKHYRTLFALNQETELSIQNQIQRGRIWVGNLNSIYNEEIRQAVSVSIIPVGDEKQQLTELIFLIPLSR